MNDMTWLLGIPILVPFLGAGISMLLARHHRAQQIFSVLALSIVLVASGLIVAGSMAGPMILDVGGWAAPVGVTLVADRLSAMMLLVSVFVTGCVLVYSFSQDLAESQRLPVSVFQPTFLILSAGVSNAFLTGDLFNLYVGFEILLVSSFVLITLGGTQERMRAGAIYVIVSVVSSAMFLIALAMVYAATGTVNMAQLALRLPEIDPGTAQLLQVMLLVAFGVKAAVFPLSAWLPDSYPTAPAPVTAVFAGLLTKVGVYAMIRTLTTIFGDLSMDPVLGVVGILTMIVGILGALAQDDIKRLLSFTLVSHIGFMVWGISTGTTDGLAAAIFYTAHHIIVQTALFLVSGLIEQVGGSTSLERLGGLLKSWPLLAVLFLVPAFNLAGFPPMSGFIGKVGLISASAKAGGALNIALITAGLVCSLLTMIALLQVWNMAFWQPATTEPSHPRLPRTMLGSTIALILASLVLTFAGGPIFQFSWNAASSLRTQVPYVQAVLPDAQRGTGKSVDEAEEKKPDTSVSVSPAPRSSASAKPSASGLASPSATNTPGSVASELAEPSASGGEG